MSSSEKDSFLNFFENLDTKSVVPELEVDFFVCFQLFSFFVFKCFPSSGNRLVLGTQGGT